MAPRQSAGGHQGQTTGGPESPQPGQALAVAAAAVQLDPDPGPAGKTLPQPAARIRVRLFPGQPERQTAGQANRQVGPGEPILALGRRAPAAGDQGREPRIADGIGGQQHQPRAVRQLDLAADNQLQSTGPGPAVGPHHPGQGAEVGQGPVAQFTGPFHQFLRVGGGAQKTEIGAAVQLGVAGQRYAVHKYSI